MSGAVTAAPGQPVADDPLFEFAPLSQRRATPRNSREVARRGLAPLMRRFWGQSDRTDTTALEPLAEHEAGRFLPELDWGAAAAALEGTLRGLGPKPRGVAVLSSGGEAAAVLTEWATAHGHPLVEPAPREALPTQEGWPALPPSAEETLVIPNLAEHLLRQYEALGHLRRWLGELARRSSFVVGCSVWTWDYLRGVLDVEGMCRDVVALQPAQDAALRRWLGPRRPSGPEGDGDDQLVPWLNRAALGSPRVARALWRRCLAKAPGRAEVVVARPAQVTLPELPEGSGTWEAVVLDAALIHERIDEELLLEILALHRAPVSLALRRLRSAGLVECRDGLVAVTPEGLPAAAWFLRSQGWKPSWI